MHPVRHPHTYPPQPHPQLRTDFRSVLTRPRRACPRYPYHPFRLSRPHTTSTLYLPPTRSVYALTTHSSTHQFPLPPACPPHPPHHSPYFTHSLRQWNQRGRADVARLCRTSLSPQHSSPHTSHRTHHRTHTHTPKGDGTGLLRMPLAARALWACPATPNAQQRKRHGSTSAPRGPTNATHMLMQQQTTVHTLTHTLPST